MGIDQKDVTSTICEYINTENTNYAILLSGLWGSGKTYYWKNELQEKIEDVGFSTLYISLNGLDKTEQIARKIVTSHWKSQSAGLVNVEALEKHKGLFSGTLSNLGSIVKNLSSVAGIANSLVKIDLRPENMIDYIDFKETVICFDDLERCSDITKALGFINDFVEHKKTKVLILANEDMIRDKLSAVKEKVVGKTIKFAIDKKVILTNIIDSYPEEVRDYFLSEIDLIIKMMECSKSCNYRVVRTILDDFDNIYQRSKEQPYFHTAKTPLLKYALAVGLEIRVKGIKEEEKELIRKTSESAYISWEISRNFNKQKEQEEAEPYNILFKKRYYSNDFEGRYLFHSVFDYIDFGYLDTTKFTEEISRYEEKELTALQFLMSVGYWKMSDADFEARVKGELLTDIENGDIQIGLYPNLFTWFGYFQQNLLINCSLEELEEKFFKGMKVIEKAGKSDYYMNDTSVGENVGEVKLAYERIRDYADGVRIILRNNHFDSKSNQFIEAMKSDIDDAIRLVTNGETGLEYNQIPLFSSATVEGIYDILINTSNDKIVRFNHFLTNRYEYRNPYLKDILKVDYDFLKNLAEHILELLPESQFRLSQHLLKLLAKEVLQKCCKA